MLSPMHVAFCMPAYNEEAIIAETVRRCVAALRAAGLQGEVVVCNDCSRDRTGEILAGLQAEYPELRVITHEGQNQGYGAALRDAIRATDADWIATIDSDLQFAPEELERLVQAQATHGVDLVLGYRHRKQDALPRVVADRALNLIVRLLFGVRVRDCNCAYKLVKGDLLRRLSVESNGYSNPTETLLRLHLQGVRYVEAEVTHSKREAGASSLKFFRTAWNFWCFLWYFRKRVDCWQRGIIREL